jgi:phosphate uptake regulator
MPKDEMGMEPMDEEMMKPEKKGITIMKLESSKKPEMEEEDDDMEEEDDEESIDPLSSLARLKERLKKGRM